MKTHLPLTLIVGLLTAASSVNASMESVNPFNQFMAPSGGVNLYSGGAAFSLPITTLGGTGPSVPIGLSYSSNVQINAVSRNDVAPAGWVGLGWSLGFGSIIANHKGTTTYEDDDYTWISPEGVPAKLIPPNRLKYTYYDYVAISLDGNTPNMPMKGPYVIKSVEGACEYFNTRFYQKETNYGYVIETKIKITDISVPYIFTLVSDDGSALWINGTLVIGDNGGMHGVQWKEGTYTFAQPGFHDFKVEYFQAATQERLDIYYRKQGSSDKQIIPASILFHPDFIKDGGDSPRTYYAENNPHVKFIQQFDQATGYCTGWRVTQPDGTKYLYGNLDLGSDRYATRYTLHSADYVGTVNRGTPPHYPYRWDLSEIRDISGNATKFWYQQEEKKIIVQPGGVPSGEDYTKASYPQKIQNSVGAQILFNTEPNNDGSGHLMAFDPVGDGFMRVYDSKRLQSIDFRLPGHTSGDPDAWYKFEYDILRPGSQVLSAEDSCWEKALLARILEYHGGLNSSNLANTTTFNYNNNPSSTDPNYAAGALLSIATSSGGVTNYTYTKQPEASSTLHYSKISDNTRPTCGDGCNLTPCRLHGANGFIMHSGTYDNGKEYALVQCGDNKDRIWFFTFDGWKWDTCPQFAGQCFSNTNSKEIIPFKDGFVYKDAGHVSPDQVKTFFWRKNKWCSDALGTGSNGYGYNAIWPLGSDFLIARGGNRGVPCSGGNPSDNYMDQLWVYNRMGDAWISDPNFDGKRPFTVTNKRYLLDVQPGSNFFLLRYVIEDTPCDGNYNNHSTPAKVYNWTGFTGYLWDETDLTAQTGYTFEYSWVGPDYIVFNGGAAGTWEKSRLWIYRWDGLGWVLAGYPFDGTVDIIPTTKSINVSSGGDNFFVYGPNFGNTTTPETQMNVMTWTGETWNFKILSGGNSDYYVQKVLSGSDYFIIFCKVHSIPNDVIVIYNKKGNSWVRTEWTAGQIFNFRYMYSADLLFSLGNNAFAVTNSNRSAVDNLTHRAIMTYNGVEWKNSYVQQFDAPPACHNTLTGTAQGFGFIGVKSTGNEILLDLLHKYNDKFDEASNYVVSSKKLIARPGETSNNITTFTYENSHFDARIGAPKFNKVTTTLPGNNGSTVQYFFNGVASLDDQGTKLNLHEGDEFAITNFDGMPYRSENINSTGRLVSSSETFYTGAKPFAHWPYKVFDKRVDSTKSTSRKVTTTNVILEYNDTNNIPTITRIRDINGKQKFSKTFFAFKEPQYITPMGMSGANILTQPSQNIVYQNDWFEYIHPAATYSVPPNTRTVIPMQFTADQLSRIKSGAYCKITFETSMEGSYPEHLAQFYVRVNGSPQDCSIGSVMVQGAFSSSALYFYPHQFIITYPITSFVLEIFNIEQLFYLRNIRIVFSNDQYVPDSVLSASATTYSNSNGIALSVTSWVPWKSYTWNVPCDATGVPLPGYAFADFDHTPGADNQNWQLGGTAEVYDFFGTPVQTSKPSAEGSIQSVTVMRNDLHVPIGSITGSNFYEGSVFTGDYKCGTNPNYWDYANGWEKGATNTCEAISDVINHHFGDKVIHVINDYAAGRNNRIIPGKAYLMTAWVKVTAGTIYMATDFRYANTGYENEWPATQLTTVATPPPISATPISYTDCNGYWKLMRLEIPASVTSQLDPLKVWYARAWIGNDPAQPTFTAYVDDIRFRPDNSITTTTYYDLKWQQPILSIDDNNNPGQKVAFDALGRPAYWYKVHKTTAGLTLRKSRAYHTMYDGVFFQQPNQGDLHDFGASMIIEWFFKAPTRQLNLYLSRDDGKTWSGSPINATPITSTGAVQQYTWTIPEDAIPAGIAMEDRCRIKVVEEGENLNCGVSPQFTIRCKHIFSPAGGEKWHVGTSGNIILWELAGATNVDISYWNGTTYVPIVTNYANTNGKGSYSWTIPSGTLPNSNTRIRVSDYNTGAGSAGDIESELFSIDPAKNIVTNFIPKWIMDLYMR